MFGYAHMAGYAFDHCAIIFRSGFIGGVCGFFGESGYADTSWLSDCVAWVPQDVQTAQTVLVHPNHTLTYIRIVYAWVLCS